jgi:hypothetical protein
LELFVAKVDSRKGAGTAPRHPGITAPWESTPVAERRQPRGSDLEFAPTNQPSLDLLFRAKLLNERLLRQKSRMPRFLF